MRCGGCRHLVLLVLEQQTCCATCGCRSAVHRQHSVSYPIPVLLTARLFAGLWPHHCECARACNNRCALVPATDRDCPWRTSAVRRPRCPLAVTSGRAGRKGAESGAVGVQQNTRISLSSCLCAVRLCSYRGPSDFPLRASVPSTEHSCATAAISKNSLFRRPCWSKGLRGIQSQPPIAVKNSK